MHVFDNEGMTGKIVDCSDMHNVHVVYEDGYSSGLFCLVEGCTEDSKEHRIFKANIVPLEESAK